MARMVVLPEEGDPILGIDAQVRKRVLKMTTPPPKKKKKNSTAAPRSRPPRRPVIALVPLACPFKDG